MPRLLTQRPARRRKIPPCGRLIEYRTPHSPFQKLIDSNRQRLRLSGRQLAARIGVSPSTLWIWLHNTNGFPHPKSFKAEHVRRLSKTLKIPARSIERALDSSRHLFTRRESPMPHRSLNAFAQFIGIIEHDRRQAISRSYVLNLAKTLYSGAH